MSTLETVAEKRIAFKKAVEDFVEAKKIGMPTVMKEAMTKAKLAGNDLISVINSIPSSNINK